MPEHHGAVLVGVLVDGDTDLHAGQQPRQAILALAERQRPVVDPVELQQVESLQDGALIRPRLWSAANTATPSAPQTTAPRPA